MKTTTLQELKKELQELPPKEVIELCVALAKYKKDNKEYLGYLMFEAHNKTDFIKEVKAGVDEHFEELKMQPNLYYVKKGLRKQLRLLTKYSKYVNDKTLTADLLIYFCRKLKQSGIPFHKNKLIVNMYALQLKRINVLVASFHEDLQQDYRNDLEEIS
jgi:superfamily II DNA/RNA helicase